MTPWRSHKTTHETELAQTRVAKPMDAKERREMTLGALLMAGVIALGAAMASGDFATPEPTSATASVSSVLSAALARCPSAGHPDASGGAVTVAGQGAVAMARLGCILEATNAPARVLDHITSTRSEDGEQVEEWDDLQAHWIRQDDGGLTFTIEQDG